MSTVDEGRGDGGSVRGSSEGEDSGEVDLTEGE
jgi:hypothetical protein